LTGRPSAAWPPRRGPGAADNAREGNAVAMVEYDARVVDLLCKLPWLEERAAGDRAAIGEAIGCMLADAAGI